MAATLTFDQLPEAVSELSTKVDQLLSFLANGTLFPSKPEQDEILTINEAADFIKKKVTTLYSLCSAKAIPHSKQGGRLYFSKKALTDWILTDGHVKTTAEAMTQAAVITNPGNRNTTKGAMQHGNR